MRTWACDRQMERWDEQRFFASKKPNQTGLTTVRTIMTVLGIALFLGVSGCASAREEGDNTPRRRQVTRSVDPSRLGVDLNLARQHPEVKTVQVYAGGDETSLPVYSMQDAGSRITIEFDLLVRSGRPLSAYFYHADRRWRRDLTPAEYLDAFQRDDLLDFRPSHATSINYTHYTYTFPNNSIDFRISGNYIIRITEQGRENEVLFERPFFVSEQSAGLEVGLENLLVGGQNFPSVSPIVRFTPPDETAANVYDFDVCFVRGGRIEYARCADRPSLISQPSLQFYLQPEAAFQPEPGDYYLDLTNLRVGDRIERTNFDRQPFTVLLEPDYAQFPASGIDPVLNGQTVVEEAVRTVSDPDHGGEYVEALFSFVPPDETPLTGDLVITGSFNGWQYDSANRLIWAPENGRYEGSVLLKQGAYEYRYVSSDRRLRNALAGTPPRSEALYLAMVYYSDLRVNTDRLITVGGAVSR